MQEIDRVVKLVSNPQIHESGFMNGSKLDCSSAHFLGGVALIY